MRFSTSVGQNIWNSVLQAKEQPCVSSKAERRGGGGVGQGGEAEELGQGQGHRVQDQLPGQGDLFESWFRLVMASQGWVNCVNGQCNNHFVTEHIMGAYPRPKMPLLA